jgi:hypothetical protein
MVTEMWVEVTLGGDKKCRFRGLFSATERRAKAAAFHSRPQQGMRSAEDRSVRRTRPRNVWPRVAGPAVVTRIAEHLSQAAVPYRKRNR